MKLGFAGSHRTGNMSLAKRFLVVPTH